MAAIPASRPQPGAASLASEPDERIVALARSGSDAAFECIVRRYEAPLRRYVGRILGGADGAEDIVQQTFMAALRFLRDDPRPLLIGPWLYRVAHNAAVNVGRRGDTVFEPLSEDFDGVAQPPELVERREALRLLVSKIHALPTRQRKALVLRELEGRSHAEIAAALGVDRPAARQLIFRARSRLRESFGALTTLPLLRAWLPGAGGSVPLGAGAGVGAALAKASAVALTAGAVAAGMQASTPDANGSGHAGAPRPPGAARHHARRRVAPSAPRQSAAFGSVGGAAPTHPARGRGGSAWRRHARRNVPTTGAEAADAEAPDATPPDETADPAADVAPDPQASAADAKAADPPPDLPPPDPPPSPPADPAPDPGVPDGGSATTPPP